MTDVGVTSNLPPPASPPGLINLTTVTPASGVGGGGGSGGGATPPGSATSVTPYNLDETRQQIAFILLGILGFIILIQLISSAVLAAGCWSTATLDKAGVAACPQAQASLGVLTSVLGTVFTAMIGLVGSVVGFYFGSQKANPTP